LGEGKRRPKAGQGYGVRAPREGRQPHGMHDDASRQDGQDLANGSLNGPRQRHGGQRRRAKVQEYGDEMGDRDHSVAQIYCPAGGYGIFVWLRRVVIYARWGDGRWAMGGGRQTAGGQYAPASFSVADRPSPIAG